MKEYAKAFYKGADWRKCRKSYIAYRISVDGGLCEECHCRLGYIVHHKKPITEFNIDDPDITYNFDNLEYVCKDCHDMFDGHGVGHKGAAPLCTFDEEGQPISLREIDRLPPSEDVTASPERPRPPD